MDYIKKKLHQLNESEFKYHKILGQSQFYKDLKELVHDANPSKIITPKRLLEELVSSQNEHIRKLSFTDVNCLKLVRNLLYRWAKNYHSKSLN